MMDVVVAAQNLQLGYGRKIVVDGIDLQVYSGVTAILGPNGAGKSTLLQAIATAKKARGGSLHVLGHSAISSSGRDAIRSDTSLLAQSPGYQRGFTVIEHLRYSCWLKGADAADARIQEVLAAMDLTNISRRRLKTLSGGQLRRTMLAGALASGPALLILDEPTASLDPVQRQTFQNSVKGLPDSVSVIFSTHLLGDVGGIADDVIVLQAGQTRFQGSPEDLLKISPEADDDGTAAYAKLVE